ncbi:hypothetical protein QYF36_017877 [Acer negundo]|nr:hypothetical protein QYF36_017877 [Acer negundo]
MPNNQTNDSGVQSETGHRLNFSIQFYAILVFLINTSCTLLQIKYQTQNVSPFDTHYGVMLTFFVVVHVHAVVLVVEIKLQAHISSCHAMIMSKISIFSGALASILLLLILVPPFGWFSLVMWVVCFIRVAHDSYKDFCQLFYQATLQVLDLLKSPIKGRLFEQQNQLPV